ncbi:MAG: class I tRNA ligase family protein, partial [Blastocatellia bacterium]
RRKTHQTIRRITHDISERMNFNTGVAALMELTNEVYAFDSTVGTNPTPGDLYAIGEALAALAKMLAPFSPHIAEALWTGLGHDEILLNSPWPSFDEDLARDEELEIPVQLNGKLIARLLAPADVSEADLISLACSNDRVLARLEGRQIVKTIVVPKRLVNLVAK